MNTEFDSGLLENFGDTNHFVDPYLAYTRCDDSHSGTRAAYKMDEHRHSLNPSQIISSFWPPAGPTML